MKRQVLEAAGVGHRISHTCWHDTGKIAKGSADTFLGKKRRAAALVDHEKVPCTLCADEAISEGSATVLVNGKPLARRDDEVGCGAIIDEGEATVLVGARPEQKHHSQVGQLAEAVALAAAGLL